MSNMSPPEGPYEVVATGEELQERLQSGSSKPLYLELQTLGIYRTLDGLKPAENTVASIVCESSTIDMTGAEEYIAAPNTKLTFWGCNIHRAHSSPLAEMTTFQNCEVFGVCQVLTVLPIDTSSCLARAVLATVCAWHNSKCCSFVSSCACHALSALGTEKTDAAGLL